MICEYFHHKNTPLQSIVSSVCWLEKEYHFLPTFTLIVLIVITIKVTLSIINIKFIIIIIIIVMALMYHCDYYSCYFDDGDHGPKFAWNGQS